MGSPGGGVGGSSGAGSSGGSGGTGGGGADSGASAGGSSSGSSGADSSGSSGGTGGGGADSGASAGSSAGGSSGAGSSGSSGSSGGTGGGGADSGASAGGSAGGSSGAGSSGGSFNDAISEAAGQTFGGQVNSSAEDDDAAQENHHANEFDGLGATGGPVTGQDSFNSHRGYGSDGSLAGGIDQSVNDAIGQTNSGTPAAPDTNPTNVVGPAGYGAAGLQGGLEALRDHVDRGARNAAAGTLTNGNAANLPGRAELGRTINSPTMTSSKALDVTPYGPNAKSTQQLAAGAKTTTAIGRFASGAGLAIQPGAGAYQGFVNTPENASWTERATNTVIGAVKEFDDTGLSYGAGLATGMGTVAVSPFTGPAAPVVAGSAPVTATAAAVATGLAYDNSSIDQAIDGFLEDYGRPGLLGALNAVDSYVVDPVSDFFDRTFGDGSSENNER